MNDSNSRRRAAAVMAGLAAGMVVGCGPQRVPPLRPGQAQVVLLPDPGNEATVGRAVVSNQAGSVDLTAARESTTAAPNQAPAAVTVLSEADVTRLFGDVLATLPPAPAQFILYFRFESDDLTAESQALVPMVLDAVRNRPFPDVAVIGHTDTTGTAASNVELGLRRANAIRALLIRAGVSADLIAATSHGETDLLIKTADQVAEPRNRRVEITVR
jgi:outer membrane protein OmpA-like peptidoglycan-associated protein